MKLLSKEEGKFIENKRSVAKNKWGVYNSRIKSKVKIIKQSMEDDQFLMLFNKINLKYRKEIIAKLLKNLPVSSFIELVEKNSEITNKIKRKNSIVDNSWFSGRIRFLKKKGINFMDTGMVFDMPYDCFENKNNLDNYIKDILNNKKSFMQILNKKRQNDINFIEQKKDIFLILSKIKHPKKLRNIKKKFTKGEKILISQFLERGLILKEKISKREFFNKCKEKLFRKDYFVDPKDDFTSLIIFPFHSPKNIDNLKFRFNPYYDGVL
jgi:hypothetical protein